MATYVVQSGDTLGAIAAAHGTTAEAFKAANAGLITDINVIQPGWELTIPGSGGEQSSESSAATAAMSEYVVRDGDTLGALASQWGTTVAALQQLNNLPNPDVLIVGQVLIRPAAVGGGENTAQHFQGTVDQQQVPGQLRFTTFPLAMPPGRVNGRYLEQYPNGKHMGYDLGGVPVGTSILAPAPAQVHSVHRPNDGTGFDSFGICVVLDHVGTPYYSIYAHMDSTDIQPGATVQAGDAIGRLGWTGFVDPPGPGGAHLHWQISVSKWFPKSQDTSPNPADFLFGIALPGDDDIPSPAGVSNGIDGELSGPEAPPDDGCKPGFEQVPV